jgi:hypothetical protein
MDKGPATMASASRDKRGNAIVQFIGPDKRRSIRVGKISSARLEVYRNRIELLCLARQRGDPLDGDVVAWLGQMGDEFHRRLAAVGLVEMRVSAALGSFIDSYIAGRTDLSGRSLSNLGIAAKHITAYFGAERAMRSISPADADAFAIHVRKSLPRPRRRASSPERGSSTARLYVRVW